MTRTRLRAVPGVLATMCEHCGCRGVEPIAELMDEHLALLELSGEIRRRLAAGEHDDVRRLLADLDDKLTRHVGREERGVFPVAVVSLGARGWDTITEVHEHEPSFLANDEARVARK